jgi:hypothetical protein
MSQDEDDEIVIAADVGPHRDGTRLVVEERRLPLDEAADHGAGRRAYVEDRGAHLADGARARSGERAKPSSPTYLGQQGVISMTHAPRGGQG